LDSVASFPHITKKGPTIIVDDTRVISHHCQHSAKLHCTRTIRYEGPALVARHVRCEHWSATKFKALLFLERQERISDSHDLAADDFSKTCDGMYAAEPRPGQRQCATRCGVDSPDGKATSPRDAGARKSAPMSEGPVPMRYAGEAVEQRGTCSCANLCVHYIFVSLSEKHLCPIENVQFASANIALTDTTLKDC
jgi:hypothetical protein